MPFHILEILRPDGHPAGPMALGRRDGWRTTPPRPRDTATERDWYPRPGDSPLLPRTPPYGQSPVSWPIVRAELGRSCYVKRLRPFVTVGPAKSPPSKPNNTPPGEGGIPRRPVGRPGEAPAPSHGGGPRPTDPTEGRDLGRLFRENRPSHPPASAHAAAARTTTLRGRAGRRLRSAAPSKAPSTAPLDTRNRRLGASSARGQ